MTLYFEKKVQFPPSAQLGNRIYSELCWHSIHPFLAISAFDDKKGGIVSVYDHSKEETIDVDSSPKHDIQVTSLAWHPILSYLAIGYETGEVLIWNHDEGEIFEGTKSHQGPVTILRWSPCGNILLSTDTIGSLVVWTTNAQGHIQVKQHHDFNDPVVQLIARPIKKSSSANGGSGDAQQKEKESVENMERSLGKMTTWRPKTAAKRAPTGRISRLKTGFRERAKAFLKKDDRVDSLDNDTGDEGEGDDEDGDGRREQEYNFSNRKKSGAEALSNDYIENPHTVGLRTSKPSSQPTNSPSDRCFFVGLLGGAIFYLRDSGSCEEVLSADSSIKYLLYQETPELLVVMTESQLTGLFKVDSNGGLNELSKIKLSGMGDIRISWVGQNVIAVLSKELSIRLWDVESGENTLLEADPDLTYTADEVFAAVDFQANAGILSGVTNKGKIMMWKESGADGKKAAVSSSTTTEDEANNWEYYNFTTTSSLSSTKEIQWSQIIMPGTIAVNGVRDIFILSEHELVAVHRDTISVIQTQQNQAIVSIVQYVPPSEEAEDQPKKSNSNMECDEDEDLETSIARRSTSEEVSTFNLTTELQIQNFVVNSNNLCIWSGGKVEIYELSPEPESYYKLVGSFKDKCTTLCLFELSVFILEPEHIQIRSFSGTLKQTIVFISTEGFPILLTNCGEYICVATAGGYIKLWHVGQREAKLHATSPNLCDALPDFGEVIQAKNNCDGNKVAFTVAQKTNLAPDSRFFVWDLRSESIASIAFPGQFITQIFWELENSTFLAIELKCMPDEIYEQTNSSVYSLTSKLVWDGGRKNLGNDDDDVAVGDEELLKNETETGGGAGDVKREASVGQRFRNGPSPSNVQHEFATIFHTAEKGIVIHSRVGREIKNLLMGIEVPYLIVLEEKKNKKMNEQIWNKEWRNNKSKGSQTSQIKKRSIEDFDELDEVDRFASSKAALVLSIYYSTIGEYKKAHQALRPIRTKSVWLKMARRCVVTRRVDIAQMCLSHIQDFRGASALAKVKKAEPDQVDVQLATLALHLQMNKEAFELYKKAERYDLLLEIYKLLGEWDNAIAVCDKHLRIQLRTTYYEYAKFLEEEGQIDEAIEMYEKSDTFRSEVPRLLAEKGVDNFDKLEKYIYARKDKDLYKWWAQYLESGQDLDSALKFYELADDWLSLVRLLCYTNAVDKAVLLAEKVDDKASAYHLARAFEDIRDPQKAIPFYLKAQAYGAGIRICKEYQLDDQLWNFALQAEQIEQADAAKYFETKDEPDFDRAIRLYHRSGYGSKALDLAFSTEEFGALQAIVKDLLEKENQHIDPELLRKCAEFFISNKEYERAIDTLTAAKRYVEAMEMCVEYNFPISEEMAERLTAPKGAGIDEATRLGLLMKMGECCMAQGNYHLAAKKFTQGGDKVQAIKALLKSGDTERIIFYANVCRHREIYMMAAHYLQTIDLKANPQIIPTIIQFYNRAKAPESIISFYESCAQASAEEVDYGTASKHLKDAEKTVQNLLKTSNTEPDSTDRKILQNRLQVVQTKIGYVEKFLKVQQMLEVKNNEVSELIQQLLQDPNIEMSVRRGDIYACLVETFISIGEYQKAVEVIEEMKSVVTHNPIKYFKNETLQNLQKGLGSQQLINNDKNSANKSKSSSKRKDSTQLSMGYIVDKGEDHHNDGEEEEEEQLDDVESDEEVAIEQLNHQVNGEEEEIEEELNHHIEDEIDDESDIDETERQNQLRMSAAFNVGLNKFN